MWSFPFISKTGKWSTREWPDLPKVTDHLCQHWSLAACTNCATAAINPELLVIVPSNSGHSTVSWRGAGHEMDNDTQLQCSELTCYHACLECPSLISSPNKFILIFKTQPRRHPSRKPWLSSPAHVPRAPLTDFSCCLHCFLPACLLTCVPIYSKFLKHGHCSVHPSLPSI